MKTDAPIKCSCGKVEGVARGLSRSSTNHVVCSCKGCQSYAHYLGRTDDMLDAEGGSNIVQMDPSKFEITRGMENVVCMRVTNDGPLRWYTSCCNTPLGNTFPRGGLPFIGFLPICLGIKGTSEELVALVGKSRGHVNRPEKTPLFDRIGNVFMIIGLFCKIMFWRVRGGPAFKPFFDAETMRPMVKPIKISDEERAELEAKAGF
ncbi:MAG: hypothetical protein JJ850_02165 [Kordiimonadaceae bacterium]|nr:hypothetical protein [Kordiimonadaceae bacterium]MBO6567391.1 hypothetical protein [Kordiimonadaceae bacterium]MBO6963395.1 hypothetical protein [Kordiimonadaceae bacterium]